MDPETAEASLHKDTVQSTASPETVAEASTTLPFQQEEDGPVMEPPLEEAAREERKVEGGAGGGGRMETDPEQVLQSVTEKLKELYPKEAMDARWLQVGISSLGVVLKREGECMFLSFTIYMWCKMLQIIV